MQIDWWTFIAQIINLIILLFLLRKFLYKPVLKAVEARQKVIADELQHAAEERQKAAVLTKEFERKTCQIERQKQKILAAAHTEAEKLSEQFSAAAHEEYQQQRQEWQQKLLKEKKAFEVAMQNSLVEHFTIFAENALQQMADTNLNTMIVNRFKTKIQNLSADEKNILHNSLSSSEKIEIQSSHELDKQTYRELLLFLIEQLSLSTNTVFYITIKPELICGLALQAGEQLISWNFAGYLQEFKQQTDAEMQQLLKRSA